jgi:outer membrane protein assembly factor BamB
MFKRLLLLAAFSSQAVLAQRYERLIETRTISNHEIVGAEYDVSTNAVFILSNVSNQNGNGLLAKVNSLNGDTIWSKFVAPTVQQENFKGLYKSSNALFAYGLRTFQSAQYAFIAKLDFNGDTIWTKHYKTLATTACTNPHITINGLTELANGDLLLVGRNNECDRAVLLKTNSLGVVSLIKE